MSLSLIDTIQHTDGGNVHVHCIASSEDEMLIFVVAYRWGGGGMLTFIALRHQKMRCYVNLRCCIQMGGGGTVNVHCIASSEDVALKMLLH